MNLDDILNLQRLQCTGDVARAGWVLDQDAIIRAMDLLEIELPVHIRFMTGKYRRGSIQNTGDNTRHKMTIDQNKPIESANRTLWHELTHAMQAERYSRKTGRSITEWFYDYTYNRGPHGETYWLNGYEVEARQVAQDHKDDLLLIDIKGENNWQ